MQTVALTCFCLALIGAAAATPLGPVAKANADNGVLRMLAEANALGGAADPAVTTECFNYYMPIINQISSNFSVQYEQCVTVANQAAANLSAIAAQNRDTFVNQTAAICNAFTTCNSDNDTLDFFNCYVSASSSDVLEIYTLSDSASNAALSLRGGLQQISDKEASCTSAAQYTYTSQTSETYKELYACFANGLPGTSTASASSTVPPASSDSADSTAAVASSAAPVSS
ncbi:protein TsetseEP [Zeugodacus cucurbitae]|uniref:Protein TsetseEP n=1 Tax=Zeugodacus cucurbitae TaxID=28588 RepID=A0A0A1XEV4_ZEUCU|nr:protein TsetseEP [Zeugodacus cucurbitae]